ncbi:MAG: methyltransferase domain-containing protein, partial [Nanoarchaeota archaeon]
MVLKNKGKLLISVWNRSSKNKEEYISWNAGNNKVKRYYYFFDRKELSDMLEEAGFEVLKEETGRNIMFLCQKPLKQKHLYMLLISG